MKTIVETVELIKIRENGIEYAVNPKTGERFTKEQWESYQGHGFKIIPNSE